MSDNYFKYLKYKKKYFQLKKMLGGVKLPIKKLILLSEIANYTSAIYLTDDATKLSIQRLISSKFIKSQYIHTVSNFAQDPLIQFYNPDDKKYYNIINSIGWSKDDSPKHQEKIFPAEQNYINIELKEKLYYVDDKKYDLLEQTKGGNFISSPPTEFAPNGALFYVEPITEELKNILDNNLNQKIVPIKCSFKFKTYYEKNITFFRHIDEIMNFMPYGKNKFKVWVYDIIKTPEISDEEYTILKDEHLQNLDIISLNLFNKTFDLSRDNFFIIPINIGYPTYLFPEPPIFNSVYIEYDDADFDKIILNEKNKFIKENLLKIGSTSHLLISSNTDNFEDLPEYIKIELNKLKSYITDKSVKIHVINTIDRHTIGYHENPANNVPGGNLHCTIKQQLSTVD